MSLRPKSSSTFLLSLHSLPTTKTPSSVAGTGVGAATALAYAASFAPHIILTARRLEPLLRVKQSITSPHPSTKLTILPLDITELSGVSSLFRAPTPTHIVVHCVGYLERPQ